MAPAFTPKDALSARERDGGRSVDRRWAAALPLVIRGNSVSVCLITSRGTGRWILPKGKINEGENGWTCAERESFEEAGVVGRAAQTPIGIIRALPGGQPEIPLYRLEVSDILDDWPERAVRRRVLEPPINAARMLDDRELIEVLRRLASVSLG